MPINIYNVGVVQGGVANDAADSGNPIKIGGRAETTIPAAVADGDRVNAWFDEYGRTIIKDQAVYDSGTQSNKVLESSPISAHHSESTLLNLTNIATNTTGYAYIDMDGYRFLSLQGETSDGTPIDVLTVTIEATLQDDGTAQALCTYQDVTNSLFGVASWVDTDFFAIIDTPVAFKYVRVKYVTSNNAGSDADLAVYIKKMY